MESRWLGKQNSPFQLKEAHFSGRGMDSGFTFLRTASHLAWESARSTSEWVSLGSFSYLTVHLTSSAQSSGSQHPASSQSLWRWKSNTVHSQIMKQYCLISALSSPNALKATFPTYLNRWKEECSPNIATMAASNWTTSLGLASLGERGPRDHTVHTCTALWSLRMNGDSTLSSHKILKQKIRYIADDAFPVIIWLSWLYVCFHLQHVREHYSHFTQEATLRVTFEHSEITLVIPDGLVTEGWRITPFTTPTVS